MKVLVTGGRGFIGANVCRALQERGHEAVGLGRVDGDLAQAGVAEQLVAEYAPDAVVHLAAVMPGDERLAQNAPIAALVAEAAYAHGIPLFHGSTTSIYGDDTLYADSKRESESVVGDATILRFHFPYGPGQRRGAIPTMLKQALAREPLVVYRGWQRSFCFVGDVAIAVALLVERGERGEWEIGRDDDRRTLLEVAQLACALTEADESLIDVQEPPLGPARVSSVDVAPLRALGWQPCVTLEEGMTATYVWLASGAA